LEPQINTIALFSVNFAHVILRLPDQCCQSALIQLNPERLHGVLLLHLAGKAVAMPPERALGADLPVGVVNPLLMRAADDSIRHNDGFDSMILDEPQDVGSNGRVCPSVALLGEPTFHCRLGTLRLNNSNRDFLSGESERCLNLTDISLHDSSDGCSESIADPPAEQASCRRNLRRESGRRLFGPFLFARRRNLRPFAE
jgi:hypothetical protein